MQLTFAITDIHGCLDELVELQEKCLTYADKSGCVDPFFVYLGDYVDRGPNSAGVIENIRNFAMIYDTVVLKGNHDDMMVKALDHDSEILSWFSNGAWETVISYGYGNLYDECPLDAEGYIFIMSQLRRDAQIVKDALFLKNLTLSYEDDLRYFVHAGIRPGIPLEKQWAFDQLWIRHEFLNSRVDHPKHIVHGHTRNAIPELRENRTNLDTSAFVSGVLTAGVFSVDKSTPIALINTSNTR